MNGSSRTLQGRFLEILGIVVWLVLAFFEWVNFMQNAELVFSQSNYRLT